MAQKIFSSLFHFLKDNSGNFLSCVMPAIYIHLAGIVIAFYNFVRHSAGFLLHFVKPSTHKSLYRRDCSLWIGYRLPFSRVTHFSFSIIKKCNHRWCSSSSFIIGNYHRFITLHDGNTRICST